MFYCSYNRSTNCARDGYTSQEGLTFTIKQTTTDFLLNADIIEVPPTPNVFSSVVWECVSPQPRLILSQISTIWNFNQNISILALNTERKKQLTVQTVIGKNPLLDSLTLLNSVNC